MNWRSGYRRFWALAFLLTLFGASAAAQEGARPIRVAVVNTPQFSGLMAMLLGEFERASGRATELHGGSDVFELAISGQADIVIAHLGKEGFRSFVLDGHGRWPQTVFSNQAAIIGPPDDPAGIRGMTDAAAALRRIAASGSPFIVNRLAGVSYLTEILMETAGRLDKGPWIVDEGVAKGRALRLAEARKGYVIFGALPFLRVKSRQGLALEILVAGDPILQRVMASSVVDPKRHPEADVEGATALQAFLLEPRIQAAIAAYRSPGSPLQLWWPAGRHNQASSAFD